MPRHIFRRRRRACPCHLHLSRVDTRPARCSPGSLHSRGCCKCFWRWFRSSMGLLSSILLTVFIAVCSVLVKVCTKSDAVSFFLSLLASSFFLQVLIVPRFKFAAVSRLPGPPRHWLWGNVRRDLSGEESYKVPPMCLYLLFVSVFLSRG